MQISLKEIRLCLFLWKVCPATILILSFIVNLFNVYRSTESIVITGLMSIVFLIIHAIGALGFMISFLMFCGQTPLGMAVMKHIMSNDNLILEN